MTDEHDALKKQPADLDPPMEACWSHIGVWGDHTCEELEKVIHCHNCRVFTRSGQELFTRPSRPEYVQEWTQVLAEKQVATQTKDNSVIMFRLSGEWLALPVSLFMEAQEILPFHRIPHRSSDVLLGLVNIRGTLEVCISLHRVLEIEDLPDDREASDAKPRPRLVVIEKDRKRWVFRVDEMAGIHRYSREEVEPPPATLTKASRAFTKGILAWRDRRVDLLDDELLAYYLRKNLVS